MNERERPLRLSGEPTEQKGEQQLIVFKFFV